MAGEKAEWAHLIESQVGWHEAGQLLRAGQYDLVAEILCKLEIANEQMENIVLAAILAAIREICLACAQHQAGAEWLRQAYEEASEREHELRQQLCMILDLISENGLLMAHLIPPASLSSVEPKPVGRDIPELTLLHLWQRIQELLIGKSRPQLAGQKATAPAVVEEVKAPATPLAIGFRQEKEKAGPPSLAVYCLGPFRVYRDGQLLEKWSGHKSKSIFKYLLINRKEPAHQEVLMDLFWPDVEPEIARRNLYQTIYILRHTLHSGGSDFPYILCEESCYQLNPDLELWLDSEAFSFHYQAGQQLEHEGHSPEAIKEYELAENLYEGEFLIEDIYEDWSLVPRENLKHAHLDILDRLSQSYFDQKQFALCIAFCQKLLVEDNCREDAHRRLMYCYLHQGQRHLALHQYHRCVETLKQELDVPPMPATVELYRQIQENRVQFSTT